MYTAEVIADSISPDGHRITTVKAVYPHAVHKDMLRHRNQNRSVESFRAQPPEQIIANLKNGHAFMPDVFAQRVKGMGQGSELEAMDAEEVRRMWLDHLDSALRIAGRFLEYGIAKQQVNFVLQDFSPLTEVITATDWSNFFALRLDTNEDGSPVARPEVYKTVKAIKEAIDNSEPVPLEYEWLHLPFVTEYELGALCEMRASNPNELERSDTEDHWSGVSAGRCARISYGDYEWWNERSEVSYERSRRLLKSGHMSPFEHQARPFSAQRWRLVRHLQYEIRQDADLLQYFEVIDMQRQIEYSGNLHGWVSARKMIPNEHDYSLMAHQFPAAYLLLHSQWWSRHRRD